jgi:hypothetical protein
MPETGSSAPPPAIKCRLEGDSHYGSDDDYDTNVGCRTVGYYGGGYGYSTAGYGGAWM